VGKSRAVNTILIPWRVERARDDGGKSRNPGFTCSTKTPSLCRENWIRSKKGERKKGSLLEKRQSKVGGVQITSADD